MAIEITNPNTLAALPIKNETVNFAVVVKLNDAGKITEVRHTSSEKEIAKLQATDYAGGETVAFLQPVIKPSAGTLDGFEELIPDAEERLNIINKGLSAKFNQKIRTTLIELDEAGNLAFQPVEPVYDATSLVQAAAERVNMSPTEKAMKVLGALDPEVLKGILAQFAALQS